MKLGRRTLAHFLPALPVRWLLWTVLALMPIPATFFLGGLFAPAFSFQALKFGLAAYTMGCFVIACCCMLSATVLFVIPRARALGRSLFDYACSLTAFAWLTGVVTAHLP